MNTEKIQHHDLAYKYAQAFLNVYWDKLQEKDFEALPEALTFFQKRKRACFLMRLSSLSEKVKCAALKKVRIQLGLSPCFDRLFSLLIEHKRSFLFEVLFKNLLEESYKRKNHMCFMVESAGKLSQKDKKNIQTFLEKTTQKTVSCSFKQNAQLIAGIRLKNDNFLWETSVRGRLNRIRSTLKR